MTTQGCEKHNHNNHPFSGRAGGVPFALAHNGILHNDHELRRQRKLPSTKIETDSYVAVQLIERSGELSFASLKQMAEAVEGTFTFTVTDNTDNLYIVKGNNPLCLYHWPKLGLYLYASTEDILKRALQGIRLKLGKPQEVNIDSGRSSVLTALAVLPGAFSIPPIFSAAAVTLAGPTAFPSGTTIPLMTAMCPN